MRADSVRLAGKLVPARMRAPLVLNTASTQDRGTLRRSDRNVNNELSCVVQVSEKRTILRRSKPSDRFRAMESTNEYAKLNEMEFVYKKSLMVAVS